MIEDTHFHLPKPEPYQRPGDPKRLVVCVRENKLRSSFSAVPSARYVGLNEAKNVNIPISLDGNSWVEFIKQEARAYVANSAVKEWKGKTDSFMVWEIELPARPPEAIGIEIRHQITKTTGQIPASNKDADVVVQYLSLE